MEAQFTFINFLDRGGVFNNSCENFILTLVGYGAEVVLALPVRVRNRRLRCRVSRIELEF